MGTLVDWSVDQSQRNTFHCRVKRAACYNVFYTPERVEYWKILAKDEESAYTLAKYNFYRSDPKDISIRSTPFDYSLVFNTLEEFENREPETL